MLFLPTAAGGKRVTCTRQEGHERHKAWHDARNKDHDPPEVKAGRSTAFRRAGEAKKSR